MEMNIYSKTFFFFVILLCVKTSRINSRDISTRNEFHTFFFFFIIINLNFLLVDEARLYYSAELSRPNFQPLK